MSNPDQIIQNKARMITAPILCWKFIPNGYLYLDNSDIQSYTGQVHYLNKNYETGKAIKVKDWVFYLERMTPEARARLAPNNDPELWIISGLHKNTHYSFVDVKGSNQDDLNNKFINYIIKEFFPILRSQK